jgi:threonine dehydrogenase-like Zn-dependent dehydrogenase
VYPSREDVPARVLELTGGTGADVAFERQAGLRHPHQPQDTAEGAASEAAGASKNERRRPAATRSATSSTMF